MQKMISDSLTHSVSHVNNSFELYKSLSSKKIHENDILILLDAVSLFINIPLNLAIEKIRKRRRHFMLNR